MIGFMIAAPLGPVALLCMRRTLTHGLSSGRVSGLGAATAHSLYGLVAGLGIAGISSFLLKSHIILGVAGGIFLCYLGVRTFRAQPPAYNASPGVSRRLQNYASTLALAITNPLTILSFISIFVGFGIRAEHYLDPLLLMIGIFAGSMAWWFVFTFFVSLFSSRMSGRSMFIVNRVSGALIFTFGIATLIKA